MLIFGHMMCVFRENYSLWFCPFALLPSCPFALLLFAPLPFYPFALMPLPLPPPWLFLSFGGYQEKIFFVFAFTFWFMCRYCRLSWCYSCLHRWQLRWQTTSMPFLAANVEALSKHLKAWRWPRSRCRPSWDFRIWIANAKYLFWHLRV